MLDCCAQGSFGLHQARSNTLPCVVSEQASGSLDLRPTATKVSCQAPALSASATLHTRPPSLEAMKQALTQVCAAYDLHSKSGSFEIILGAVSCSLLAVSQTKELQYILHVQRHEFLCLTML